MAEALYTRDILRLATSLPIKDEAGGFDAEAHGRSPLCGSEITVQLQLAGSGNIKSIFVDARSCAIGQASAAIFYRNAVGYDLPLLRALHAEMQAFLAGDGPLPACWPELEHLAPTRAYPARHPAILLPYEAAIRALESWHARIEL